MNLYIDESGIITKNKDKRHRYFVVSVLETDEPRNVIRHFRKAKMDYIKKNETNFDVRKEIKGSEMPYGMKKEIFQQLAEKTDAIFHFKLIDNFNITDNLLTNTSLAFNYFVYLTIDQIKNKTKSNEAKLLNLQLDERNTAVGSLNSLEEYLRIKFMIEQQTLTKITTSYKDSSKIDLIQIVDLFSNTVFRVARNHAIGNDDDKKNRELIDICNLGCQHFFPWYRCDIDICCK